MKQQLLSQVALWWGALISFLLISNPSHLPILLLMVPFVLVFLAIRASWRLVEVMLSSEPHNNSSRAFAERGSLLASILVALLALASIGQLTARDVLTVTLLSLLGYFYITRNSKRT